MDLRRPRVLVGSPQMTLLACCASGAFSLSWPMSELHLAGSHSVSATTFGRERWSHTWQHQNLEHIWVISRTVTAILLPSGAVRTEQHRLFFVRDTTDTPTKSS